MSGFLDGISNLLHKGANFVRDVQLSPEEIRGREETKRFLEMVKLASVVVVVTKVLLFVIFPNLFTLCLLPLVGIGARDVIKVADNYLEIFDSYALELQVSVSRRAILDQLTKNTWIIGTILRILVPPGELNR